MRLPFLRTPLQPPAPVVPFHAIGDVHGRLDLLSPLLRRIARRGADDPIVILGDMIDRGPDSAGVLRMLYHWRHQNLVCLAGNHEAMMLGFLDDPVRNAAMWLRNGGIETLQSFGIAPPELTARGAASDCAHELAQALGPLQDWLRGLPLRWSSGNVVAVHAALDPARPPGMQDEKTLLWGHPRCASTPRRDGLWVVHGHVVQDAPSAKEGRISLDTGAWHTGRLSAARIAAGAVDFVHSEA